MHLSCPCCVFLIVALANIVVMWLANSSEAPVRYGALLPWIKAYRISDRGKNACSNHRVCSARRIDTRLRIRNTDHGADPQ